MTVILPSAPQPAAGAVWPSASVREADHKLSPAEPPYPEIWWMAPCAPVMKPHRPLCNAPGAGIVV